MKKSFQMTVLGSRGSMAACRDDCSAYGGDTSCYMVRAGNETIFLDGGSGLASAPAVYPKAPVILLSHLHLDHIMGLGMFTGFFIPGQQARLYVPFCEDDESAARTIAQVFAPPFWPLKLTDLEGKPKVLAMPRKLSVGELEIETMEGHHPDRTMVYRLSYDGRSIVYATDYEVDEASFERLIAFSRDADLLLYDAQFTEEEYHGKKGFGHSTAEKGIELMEKGGVRRLMLVHHAPSSSDRVLRNREKLLNRTDVLYAREGDTLDI